VIETIFIIAIGLMGGVAVGTQAPIAGAMGQRIGGASSSLIVHLGGTVASLLLLIARRGEQIEEWPTLPWYMPGCGAFGLATRALDPGRIAALILLFAGAYLMVR